MRAIMISGRTLAQGASCEAKMGQPYMNEVSTCSFCGDDLGSLGLVEGGNVVVASTWGQVVLKARLDKGLPPGIIFIPMGPWANMLVGPDTGGCGMPHYKGVAVEVTPTEAEVENIRAMFRYMEART